MSYEDQTFLSTPKYKQFTNAIDKSLKNFEYSSEWADLISCLGKLNKVIQTYAQFTVIPRKLLIGKRLAQCLHPALPSGVHLKVLETYSLILKQIGPARLAQDLFIYSAGLFPVLSQASIAVRPILLDLYEAYFLPLRKKLYPGLSGFLVALFPGIEEGSEYAERTTNLLVKLSVNTSEDIFFTCLWDTVLHSATTRLSAMTFVIGYLGKKPGDTRNIVIGRDINLMVNGLCASLDDTNVLVQRITLDFTMNFITFHSKFICKKFVVKLLTFALGVLLRRDMSLNRRIYQWFLNVNSDGSTVNTTGEQGTAALSGKSISYFETYVREPLTVAMIVLFRNVLERTEDLYQANSQASKNRQAHLKPFRILITLLDKPEVGSAILEDMMLEIFRTMYIHSQLEGARHKTSENSNSGTNMSTLHIELIKNANLLFNSLEPFFLWDFLCKVLKKCCTKSPSEPFINGSDNLSDMALLIDIKSPTYIEVFTLISFLLDVVVVETSIETQSEHWPNLLKHIIQEMIRNISSLDLGTVLEGISLISKLFSRLSPNFALPSQHEMRLLSPALTTSSRTSPQHQQTKLSSSFETDSISQCIELSKNLFERFVSNVVLKDNKNLMLIFKDQEPTGQFESMQSCREKSHTIFPSFRNHGEDSASPIEKEETMNFVAQTFQIFCQYLVRISCFPLPAKNSSRQHEGTGLPEWLQSLLICSCYDDCFDIQATALSTLLDLVNVTLNVQIPHEKSDDYCPMINPLISRHHLQWIQCSNLFEVLAKSLWYRLTPYCCQNLKRSAELFLQLHNITSSSNICEDVINNAMVNYDSMDKELSHWRFSSLWHLSREFYKDDNNKPNKGTRTIDKCMFLMIDSLQSDHPKLRECAEQWLQHSIAFGDIGRILETILLILMHPSTSRVAIHYAPLLVKKPGTHLMTGGCGLEKLVAVVRVKNHEIGSSGKEQISSDDEKDKEKKISSVNSSPVRSNSQLSAFADDEDDDRDDDVGDGERNEDNASLSRSKKERTAKIVPTHPLLIHKLMYTQTYDVQQCLYALKHISSILKVEGRAFICSATTTSMNVCNTPHQALLRELLIRHRRVLSGKEFYGSLTDAHQLLIRASTAKYLEILLSVCLYFIRSDFHRNLKVTSTEIEGNFKVQQASAEVLTQISYILLNIARDSGKGFSVYVSDLLTRSKLQRISLHCLLSTVYAVTGDFRETGETGFYSMVECPNLTTTVLIKRDGGRHFNDLQISLLKFMESLIILESCIGTENVTGLNLSDGKKSKNRDKNVLPLERVPPFEYVPYKPIVAQPMFVSVTLTVLRENQWMHMHNHWINLLISCLPKFNEFMPKIIVPVVYQLCVNLKTLTNIYKNSYSTSEKEKKFSIVEIPQDYMLVLLNGLTSFCHYCLISTTTGGTLSSTAGRVSSKHMSNVDETSSLFSNLVQVFSSNTTTPSKAMTREEGSAALNETRDGLLGILPAILTAISCVWKRWDVNKQNVNALSSNTPLGIGQPKAVRLSILQLVTPIAMNHTVVFFASLSEVWCDYRDISFSKPSPTIHCKEWVQMMNKKYIPLPTEHQMILLEIIQAIKALTVQKIIETSKPVFQHLLSTKDINQPVSLDVCMLQFLYELLSKSADTVEQVKTDLLSLLKDSLSLNMGPPSLFLLLAILNIYVQRVPIPEERRARRDLQDLVQKFLESLNTIAASSLEGSAWFRRSLQVVTQLDQSSDIDECISSDKSSILETPAPTPPSTHIANTKTSQYSVPAILILAEYLPAMLDMIYLSEEKDKIASLLVYLVYNVIPYLKNHSNQNSAGYRACSALVAGISDYQYTLRAWRKDVYDLFLESDFFQMDVLSFRFWRIIVDRLITYDNTVFKDLMQKIVLSQSGAINIFANREQEMEQRAQLLKRLSFIIFCGEHDQYHQYLPDIQERLAESIRQLQGPFLHEQVFLCFRLLLVRMSPNHLVSLWPPILTELVLIFVHMEHELSSTGKEKKSSVLEMFLGVNGLKDPSKWLQLYLAVCKLLDFLLILPSEILPHYQVYKWAFSETPGVYCSSSIEEFEVEDETKVFRPTTTKKGGNSGDGESRSRHDNSIKSNDEEVSKMARLNAPISEKKRLAMKEEQKRSSKESNKQHNVSCVFLPHISRVIKILRQKKHDQDTWQSRGRVSGQLILLQRKIQSIYDLLPFFVAVTGELAKKDVEVTKFVKFNVQHVEDLIESDFIELSHTIV